MRESEQRDDGQPRPPARTTAALSWFAILGASVYAAALAWWPEILAAEGERPSAMPAGPAAIPWFRSPDLSAFDGGLPGETGETVAVHVGSPHQSIEDPDGRAMEAFHAALASLEDRVRERPVRVIHYGDSILTTDEISGRVRRVMQKRFGDGGHGFVLLGKPWRWYHHLDVIHGASGEWRARPLTSDPLGDGFYGLGGVAFETRERGASAWAGTVEGDLGARVASFDVSYLEQPAGGSFDILIDGRVAASVATRAERKRAAHRIVEVPAGPARLVARARGDGPVRLFGVALESGTPGLVWDSLAINGARVSVLARFDRAHWQAELAARGPDLVVLEFGANEGHNEWLSLPEYRRHMAAIIETIRGGAVNASCLVVGPLDQAERRPDGSLGSRRMPAKLSETQRAVALESGCAFFDTYTAMGGEKSMARWYATGLGGGDLVHPTEHGARRLGTWLAEALIFGYERSRSAGRQEDAGF